MLIYYCFLFVFHFYMLILSINFFLGYNLAENLGMDTLGNLGNQAAHILAHITLHVKKNIWTHYH